MDEWTRISIQSLRKFINSICVSTVSEWKMSNRLMSTQNPLLRHVMKPNGCLLGLEKLNIFMSYQIFISYWYQQIYLHNSILQASHKNHRPISRYHSMELNKLNNFCSTCLTYFLPVEIYWNRPIMTLKRLPGKP